MITPGQQRYRESGAASIFIVIFASLLMMVITLSFVKLMLSDQMQSTTNDLSQSAYDSALSGVEDGKRLLLLQQSCNGATPPSGAVCAAANAAIAAGKCDTIQAGLATGGGNESQVGTAALNQAYTCVKIITDTFDYEKLLPMGQSQIVPLESVAPFDSVVISWFSKDDISSGATVNFPTAGITTPLPPANGWPVNAPPIVRAQFMQTGNSFTLADLDAAGHANSVFLYPFKNVGATSLPDISTNTRRVAPPAGPAGVKCTTAFVSKYACTITIAYSPPAAGSFADRHAALRLNALYSDTHYSVQLYKGATPVAFNGVQPIVDVTGRANNMFRRVLARVELAGSFVYPEAAIDMKNDLCKNFSVTSNSYTPNTCDPTVQSN
jgi:hypothetical protein